MAFDSTIATATIYMEASGEGFEGILGVAYVIVNRWKSGRFGKTIAAVCLKPLQFSCWNTTDSNRLRVALLPDDDSLLDQCGKAYGDAMSGAVPDPTDGAMYYFADSIPTPHWIDALSMTCKIGHQSFYR
jgi:spore germination cell wall hydrolase CwlJ-like protein